MARLLKGERMSDPPRVRRLSFKTKAAGKGGAVRAVRVTVPSNSVAAIASKFNAVVVEDEHKGRAILKKKLSAAASSSGSNTGSVREAVRKFEGLHGAKIVLVRKNSSLHVEKPREARLNSEGMAKPKPNTRPKPTIDRKSNSRYVRKDFKELLSKEKRFSLPKDQLLDEVFNEDTATRETSLKSSEEHDKNIFSKDVKNETTLIPTLPHLQKPPVANKSSLHRILKSQQVSELSPGSPANKNEKEDQMHPEIIKLSGEQATEIQLKENQVAEIISYEDRATVRIAQGNYVNSEVIPLNNEKIYGNQEVVDSDERDSEVEVRSHKSKIDIRPNSSFLWGIKVSDISQDVAKPDEEATSNTVRNVQIENKENLQINSLNDDSSEKKENLEKLEIPVIRTVDKKGYGKINNLQANSSSLYRNILNQTLIGEMKERLEKMERVQVKKTPDDGDCPGSGYEEVEDAEYEVVGGVCENSYDEIGVKDEEAIYDDVTLHGERIYESIYNGNLKSQRQGDSDSSSTSDLRANSLYELRPPSQASSGGSVVAGRSDTSDEWVDIELECQEEQKEQIILLHAEVPRTRPEGWTAKVRRQWSSRSNVTRVRVLTHNPVGISSPSIVYLKYDDPHGFEVVEQQEGTKLLSTLGLISLREVYFSTHYYEVQEVTIYISNKEDSDSSSKHYELVENKDDDSAVCDDFDDSSDSEFSDAPNSYKPNIEERLEAIETKQQTERIYGLMKEAGKRMRKTSSTIGKSLRRISRITSAQDIFSNQGSNNGLPRGKWPSFKKKTPQATSTFYLNEANIQRSPPPRPPPPDPRRLSVSIRPTSPPPPPPTRLNGETKGNDTKVRAESLYADSGLFPDDRRSWYSDIGLYENHRPFSDTASEHGSSQGSDMDLRFADEPLYQFYTERVAKEELGEESGYEEIGESRNSQPRPSALDLVSPELHRTLWCQVPQVIASGILDTLTQEQKKLQEAKFEVVTSEASYYKSLTILEKHFAASPLLKDETVLPKVHYKTLFGNVSSVRKCSEAVLAALEKCWQESILLEGISDVINQVAEKHFSVYKKYCTNQLAIERTVKSLKKTNPAFAEALLTLQKSPKCHNLAFYSFVLLPMQRITRMPLLMDAIFTRLQPDDAEYESCRLALARLNKIVHDCNEAARQSERMEEMILLSRAITFPADVKRIPLLSASRWLVRSGDMSLIPPEAKTTFSRKLTTPRQAKLRIFLFTDYLVITKKKAEDNFIVVTYCERNLVQMADIEDPLPNRFLIMLTLLKNHEGKTQEMVLCCGGESSRARWMAALSPPEPDNPGERLYEDWDCPQVCANHPYLASQPDELQLQSGDVINVLRKTVDGWYYGERMRDGEKGWFPGNHTTEILSAHVRARNLKQRYRLLALSSNFIQQQLSNKPT